MSIPFLEQEDLIGSEKNSINYRKTIRCYDFPRILRPDEIPIHPSLLEQDFLRQEQFIQKVFKKTQEEFPEKLKELSTLIEQEFPEDLTEKIGRINTETGCLAGIGIYSTTIRFPSKEDQKSGEYEIWYDNSHPLPEEKAKKYSLSEEEIVMQGWAHHNITYQGFGVEMFLRTFAINFNNLGLKTLSLPNN